MQPAEPRPSETPIPRPRRRFLRRLCGVLFVLGLAVTAIAWLLPFRTAYEFGVYDLLATVQFFARVFLIPMAVAWLALAVLSAVARRFVIAATSVALAVAWAAPEVWMAWPRQQPVSGEAFTVATFNLNKDLKDATWAAEVMRKMDANFVCVQEVSPHAGEQIKAALADVYPHAAVYPDEGFNGMAVFAKTPLRVVHAPDGSEHRDLDVVATSHGHDFLLVDVHLSPPQHLVKRRINRWQVGGMIEQYASESRPVLLAGDYNFSAMTPQAFALRGAGFVDAQLQAGRGRGTSWPSRSSGSIVPRVRIDTVYARGPLRALATETGPDVGSDHLPVKTTWQWTE